jgi:hypothetical protein
MTNVSERLINTVNNSKPKALTGLGQKACSRLLPFGLGAHGHSGYRWIGRVSPVRVTSAEQGKPVGLPSRQANREERCRTCG